MTILCIYTVFTGVGTPLQCDRKPSFWISDKKKARNQANLKAIYPSQLFLFKLPAHRLELLQLTDETGIGSLDTLDAFDHGLALGKQSGNRERHRNAMVSE